MTKVLKYPTRPTDGTVLHFFTLDAQFSWISEHRMVYHAQTPWEVYDPTGDRPGAPLIDEWMHSERYVLSTWSGPEEDVRPFMTRGRFTGWESVRSYETHRPCYATLSAACEAYLTAQRTQIAILRARADLLDTAYRQHSDRVSALLRIRGENE